MRKKSKGDEYEYDYEGDMAMSQLKSIIMNAKQLHDMMEPDTNLPEWVQSKITLAKDYIETARDYMQTEMNEEAPTVAAGTGEVAGIGVGAQGEPPVSPLAMLKRRLKNRRESMK